MVIGIVGVCAIRWIAPGNDRKEAPYRTLMWANAFLNLDSAFLFLLFESSL